MKATMINTEQLREILVEKESDRLFNEYLSCPTAFDELESGYEFLHKNAGNIQRALRNLHAAIGGKEYAQDALFTALSYIRFNLRDHCHDMAENSVPTAYELMDE